LTALRAAKKVDNTLAPRAAYPDGLMLNINLNNQIGPTWIT
jgi:hypothetical protein